MSKSFCEKIKEKLSTQSLSNQKIKKKRKCLRFLLCVIKCLMYVSHQLLPHVTKNWGPYGPCLPETILPRVFLCSSWSTNKTDSIAPKRKDIQESTELRLEARDIQNEQPTVKTLSISRRGAGYPSNSTSIKISLKPDPSTV